MTFADFFILLCAAVLAAIAILIFVRTPGIYHLLDVCDKERLLEKERHAAERERQQQE